MCVTPLLPRNTSSIVDPVTLQDISAPFEGNATLSPDGRWLAVQRYDLTTGGQELVLIEAASGAEERIEPPPGYGLVNVEWRPGHTELWAPLYQMTYDGTMDAPRTLIKQPGVPAVELLPPCELPPCELPPCELPPTACASFSSPPQPLSNSKAINELLTSGK